jgi:hypothetical protein
MSQLIRPDGYLAGCFFWRTSRRDRRLAPVCGAAAAFSGYFALRTCQAVHTTIPSLPVRSSGWCGSVYLGKRVVGSCDSLVSLLTVFVFYDFDDNNS